MLTRQKEDLYKLYNELDSEKEYKEKLYVGQLLVKLKLAYYVYTHTYQGWYETLKLENPDNKTKEELNAESEYQQQRKKDYENEIASEYHAIYDNQMGQF